MAYGFSLDVFAVPDHTIEGGLEKRGIGALVGP